MNVFQLSIKNITDKPLKASLNVVLIALSITLITVVFYIKKTFNTVFNDPTSGIQMVVGAKGSPLQLVLSSVLHMDNPTGNISYKEALKLSNNRQVKTAVPLSFGDNYKNYRIVGTTKDFYKLYNSELASGVWNTKSLEVIIGADIANNLGLKVGSYFHGSHGLLANEDANHAHHEFKVVGVLKPTYKVIDQLIVTNLSSVWDVHHQEKKESDLEITSLLLQFKNPLALLQFPRKINKETNMQAVLPKLELQKLSELVSLGSSILI